MSLNFVRSQFVSHPRQRRMHDDLVVDADADVLEEDPEAGGAGALDRFAEGLLERETLNESDLRVLLEGGELPPLPQVPEPSGATAAQGEEAVPPRFGDESIPEPEPMPS